MEDLLSRLRQTKDEKKVSLYKAYLKHCEDVLQEKNMILKLLSGGKEQAIKKRKSPEPTMVVEKQSPEQKRLSTEFEQFLVAEGFPADVNRLKKEQLLELLTKRGISNFTMKHLKSAMIEKLKESFSLADQLDSRVIAPVNSSPLKSESKEVEPGSTTLTASARKVSLMSVFRNMVEEAKGPDDVPSDENKSKASEIRPDEGTHKDEKPFSSESVQKPAFDALTPKLSTPGRKVSLMSVFRNMVEVEVTKGPEEVKEVSVDEASSKTKEVESVQSESHTKIEHLKSPQLQSGSVAVVGLPSSPFKPATTAEVTKSPEVEVKPVPVKPEDPPSYPSKVDSPLKEEKADEYIIDFRDDSSEDGNSDTDSESNEKKQQKYIPEWARGEPLKLALERQYGLGGHTPMDPDLIFPEVQTCSLEEIFGKREGLTRKYSNRTSSAHWDADQLTLVEKRQYRAHMGYDSQPTLMQKLIK